MITRAKNLKSQPKQTPGVDICLTPNCEGEVYSRGLCEACRRSASRIVCLKKATEQELIDAGLMLNKASGRPVGAFYAAFLDRVVSNRGKQLKGSK